MATCCDQGSSNISAIALLEANFPVVVNGVRITGQMSINNTPVINTSDPSHLIKCLRNMASGGILVWPTIIDGNERVVELHWRTLECLLNHLESTGKSHLTRKLTREHLDPKFKRKMKVKISTELFSETNASLCEQTGDDLVPGASDAAIVIRDIDRLFDLTNGHSSKEAKSGSIKPARQNVSNSSLHQTEFPRFLQSLAGAKFLKADRQPAGSTPTLKSWIKTIHGILAIHKRAMSEGVCDEYNPRIGISSDGLECTFGILKAAGRRRNRLTAYSFMYHLRAFVIAFVVAPSNPRGNVELDGFNSLESLITFLARSDCSDTTMNNNPNAQVNSLPQSLQDIIGELELEEYEDELDPDDPNDYEDNSLPRHFTYEDLISSLDLHGPLESLAQRMHAFEAIVLSQKCRKVLLKKVKCSECIADLTGSEDSAEYSEVLAWDPRNQAFNVPSQSLVQLVKQAKQRFNSNCKEFVHCANIFERVRRQVDDLMQETRDWPSACATHKEDLTANLASELTDQLLRDFVKETNKKYKKKPTRH